MKPKLILHIGTHRTGTTSLQRFLSQNRSKLKANDVYYPSSDTGFTPLAKWVTDPDRYGEELSDLKYHQINYPLSIVSDASLCLLETPELVAEHFHEFDIAVLVYLRDPVRFLVSSWQNDVHYGQNIVDMASYLKSKPFSYLKLLQSWSEAFPNLHVRLYDRAAMPKSDVINDFMQVTELDKISGLSRLTNDARTSISGNLLYFKLLYNGLRLPERTTEEMTTTLTLASRLKTDFRIVPDVPKWLSKVTHANYGPELASIRERWQLSIPMSSKVFGMKVPVVEHLGRDFKLLTTAARDNRFPLLDLADHLDFE